MPRIGSLCPGFSGYGCAFPQGSDCLGRILNRAAIPDAWE